MGGAPSGLLAVALISTGLLAGCAARAETPPLAKRAIYMSAVEYKGSAEVVKEAFPSTGPEGPGYTLKEPQEGKWETSSYRWEPGGTVVYQGDEVELRFWGVNGDVHPSFLEGYVPDFVVKRGQLTVVSFNADRPGIFRLVCRVHRPSMDAQFVVLPR